MQNQELKNLEMRRSQLLKEELSIQQECERSTKAGQEYSARIQRARNEMASTTADLAAAKTERVQADVALQKVTQDIREARQELGEVAAKLSQVKDDVRRSKQETRELEAIKTMQKVFTGVHGKLVVRSRATLYTASFMSDIHACVIDIS